MGRANGALQALLLQSEVESWLDELDNPAPMLRQVAALWRGVGTERANKWAWEAERHAQLWDKAYKLAAVTPYTPKVGAQLAATTMELQSRIHAEPLLHPAAIERGLASEPGS